MHSVPLVRYQIIPKVSTFQQQKCIIAQMLGQESRHNLAGYLWLTLSHKARISVLTGTATIMLKWGRAASKLIHVAVGGSQVFAGYGSESQLI